MSAPEPGGGVPFGQRLRDLVAAARGTGQPGSLVTEFGLAVRCSPDPPRLLLWREDVTPAVSVAQACARHLGWSDIDVRPHVWTGQRAGRPAALLLEWRAPPPPLARPDGLPPFDRHQVTEELLALDARRGAFWALPQVAAARREGLKALDLDSLHAELLRARCLTPHHQEGPHP